MKIISNIKGQLKRISTPKADEEYRSEDTHYGSFDIEYLSGIYIEGIRLSNIILRVSYDENEEDTISNITQMNSILSSIGLRIISFDNEEYIGGKAEEFAQIHYVVNEDIRTSDNKVLRRLYSEIRKINLVDKTISHMLSEKEKDEYLYQYRVESYNDTYMVVSQKVDMYADKCYPLLLIGMRDKTGYGWASFRISNMRYELASDITTEMLYNEYKVKEDDFIITTEEECKIRTVFDCLNLSLNDTDGLYDIDEVIE